MQKMKTIASMFILLLAVSLTGCLEENDLPTNCAIIDGKGEYTSIQDAIDAASDGDTITIYEGTYFETLTLNKSLSLIGGSKHKPILMYNKNATGSIISINANNCKIEGLALSCYINYLDIAGTVTGIKISSSNNKISNNTISNTYYGMELARHQNNNVISYNVVANNTEGIEGLQTSYNDISHNNFSNSSVYGVYLGLESTQNTVSFNTFFGNIEAVRLKGVHLNTVTQNILIDNKEGIKECCGAEGKNTITPNTYR